MEVNVIVSQKLNFKNFSIVHGSLEPHGSTSLAAVTARTVYINVLT